MAPTLFLVSINSKRGRADVVVEASNAEDAKVKAGVSEKPRELSRILQTEINSQPGSDVIAEFGMILAKNGIHARSPEHKSLVAKVKRHVFLEAAKDIRRRTTRDEEHAELREHAAQYYTARAYGNMESAKKHCREWRAVLRKIDAKNLHFSIESMEKSLAEVPACSSGHEACEFRERVILLHEYIILYMRSRLSVANGNGSQLDIDRAHAVMLMRARDLRIVESECSRSIVAKTYAWRLLNEVSPTTELCPLDPVITWPDVGHVTWDASKAGSKEERYSLGISDSMNRIHRDVIQHINNADRFTGRSLDALPSTITVTVSKVALNKVFTFKGETATLVEVEAGADKKKKKRKQRKKRKGKKAE